MDSFLTTAGHIDLTPHRVTVTLSLSLWSLHFNAACQTHTHHEKDWLELMRSGQLGNLCEQLYLGHSLRFRSGRSKDVTILVLKLFFFIALCQHALPWNCTFLLISPLFLTYLTVPADKKPHSMLQQLSFVRAGMLLGAQWVQFLQHTGVTSSPNWFSAHRPANDRSFKGFIKHAWS